MHQLRPADHVHQPAAHAAEGFPLGAADQRGRATSLAMLIAEVVSVEASGAGRRFVCRAVSAEAVRQRRYGRVARASSCPREARRDRVLVAGVKRSPRKVKRPACRAFSFEIHLYRISTSRHERFARKTLSPFDVDFITSVPLSHSIAIFAWPA